MSVEIIVGDCREVLAGMEPDSIDSCVTDPPYHLTNSSRRVPPPEVEGSPFSRHRMGVNGDPKATRGFMGQEWDGGDVAFDPDTWAAVFRVLKPGSHLIAFSGTRTYHRMACAIEDAGFEIRDQLAWIYGSGFPKSHDVSKGIDRMLGAEREVVGLYQVPADSAAGNAGKVIRSSECDNGMFGVTAGRGGTQITAPGSPEAAEWQGWGTALKPAWEPICLARKPLVGTVAANVLKHGTGAINIDGCRIETDESLNGGAYAESGGRKGLTGDEREGAAQGMWQAGKTAGRDYEQPAGRWPANIIHDGSEEVLQHFPDAPGQLRAVTGEERSHRTLNAYGDFGESRDGAEPRADSGSAARFFYCAKAASDERGDGNNHPTVKPVDLMRWLVRLVTPKGGTVLDPFAGSGSTLIAADREQFRAIGIELSEDYAAIARRRLNTDRGPLFAETAAA